MAEGRNRYQWNHTAATLAMLANVNRGAKQKPFSQSDFHPYENQSAGGKGIRLTRDNLTILRNTVW